MRATWKRCRHGTPRTQCDDESASFGPILKFAWFAMPRVMLPRRLGALAARSTRLTRAASTLAPPDPNVDFESFAFGLNDVRTEWMWHATFDAASGEWSKGGLVPHGPLQLEPSATVLNYGQCIFEGLKAFRQPDGGIGIFRPDMNAARFGEGAARMLMPQVPAETFVAACEAVVAANAHWTPPHKGGTLYLRPLLFGSGAADLARSVVRVPPRHARRRRLDEGRGQLRAHLCRFEGVQGPRLLGGALR